MIKISSHKKKFPFLMIILILLVFVSGNILAEEIQPKDAKQIKIVSLSPNLTSIVISLGAEDSLIGVTKFCKTNRKVEAIGDYLSPNIEKIVSLKPDFVLLLKTQSDIETKIKLLKIKTSSFGNNTIGEICDSIKGIGAILNKDIQAQKLISAINIAVNERKDIPVSERPVVLFVVGRQPDELNQIYACSAGTFISEIITAAGGRNAIKDISPYYPIISKESLLVMNPDIIIDSSVGEKLSESDKQRHLAVWGKLPSLAAVKSNKVFFITDPQITIPDANIPESIAKLSGLIKK